MQNELIKLMALQVQRKIAAHLQLTEFISVMIDECTDVHNQEQVKNCISLSTYLYVPLWCCDRWLLLFVGWIATLQSTKSSLVCMS